MSPASWASDSRLFAKSKYLGSTMGPGFSQLHEDGS